MFDNRKDAGDYLANELLCYKGKNPVVLGLARGGVVIASRIAAKLNTDFDLLVVRKIGDPKNPEFALGAIAGDGVLMLDQELVSRLDIPKKIINEIIRKETAELKRRIDTYGRVHRLGDVKGRLVILADDGIATGMTMLAAIQLIRKMKPAEIVIAAPVCSSSQAEVLRKSADKVICVMEPSDMHAIGQYYKDFSQVEDEKIIEMMKRK